MFTKEHHVAVAKLLQSNRKTLFYLRAKILLSKIVDDFVELFEEDNPGFDAEKFWDVIYKGGVKHEKG